MKSSSLHLFVDNRIYLPLEPNPRRYGRNPNKEEFDQGKNLIWTGTEEQFDDKALVPVEVKAGKIVKHDIFRNQKFSIGRRCCSHPW